MTNKEILKQAIEKCGNKFPSLPDVKHPDDTVTFEYVLTFDGEEKCLSEWVYNKNYYKIIFDREFAKAFWGEEEYVTETNGVWCDGKN